MIEVDRRRIGRYADDHGRPFYDALFDPAKPVAATFAELCQLFVTEKEQEHKANKVNAKRTDKIKAAVATLREIVGDATPVHTIDDDMVQKARTMLAATPNNRVKVYPKLTLAQAIDRAAKDGKPTLAPTTQAVYLDVLRDVMAEQTREGQALGMAATQAAALRNEYKLLNDAKRQGIELSPQQRAEITQLAQGMAQAEQATKRYAQTQEQTKELSEFFGNAAVDGLAGIINGTTTAEQALANLGQQLVKIALQAMLLGQGPLAGLFGGGQGQGQVGGLFGMLGSLFSGGLKFAEAATSQAPAPRHLTASRHGSRMAK